MRAAVKQAASVSRKGIRYEVVRGGKGRGLGQNGGLIAAVDERTGEELWVLKVYEVHYDGDIEGDKQDVLITDLSLSWFGNGLTVRNERGQSFDVDLDTRQVTPK